MLSHSGSFPSSSVFILLLSVVLLFSGCNSSLSKSGDKFEHTAPAHKPHSFPDLVTDLRRRIDELSRSGATSESVNQVADIIHWIPEIAAETDLRRKEWDVAAEVAQRLEVQFELARKSNRWDVETTRDLKDLADLLQPLANLCRQDPA